jgi:hypothetical protein
VPTQNVGQQATRNQPNAIRPSPKQASKPEIRGKNCGCFRRALIERGVLFDSYVHACACGYIIGESDWQKVGIAPMTSD